MSRQKLATLLGLIAGIALALSISASASETQEFHKTYPLTSNGSVTVENVNGYVHITGWDRNEVKVDAVKHADDSRYLDEARIDVNAGSDSIEIRTKYPQDHNNHHGATVEYTITVPRGAHLRTASTVNGDVSVEGVSGGIRATTVNGDVRVKDAVAELKAESVNGDLKATVAKLTNNVKLSCVNGELELTLPSDADATVSASTVHGDITNQFGINVDHSRWGPGSSMKADIGNGTNHVSLSTVNGEISLRRASDGKQISKIRNRSTSKSESYY